MQLNMFLSVTLFFNNSVQKSLFQNFYKIEIRVWYGLKIMVKKTLRVVEKL
jgi:hypothetical protein